MFWYALTSAGSFSVMSPDAGAWASSTGAPAKPMPAVTVMDANTDASKTFFIQGSWEIEKIATNTRHSKGDVSPDSRPGEGMKWDHEAGVQGPDTNPAFLAVLWGL